MSTDRRVSGLIRGSSYPHIKVLLGKISFFDVYLCSSLVNLFLCREDLVRGLLDMEQPGSDQENLDSEASLSSESLLDEQQRSSAHNSEPEGQY